MIQNIEQKIIGKTGQSLRRGSHPCGRNERDAHAIKIYGEGMLHLYGRRE